MDIRLNRQGQLIVSYPGGPEVREAKTGILWMREGIGRGGEPQFSQVSVHRQRAAMFKQLCQVCGQRITDRPIQWLMSAKQLEQAPDGETITMSPPTCSACVPIALDLCPHLRKGDWLIANVLEYEVWGVWGEGLVTDHQQQKVTRHKDLKIPYAGGIEGLDMTAVIAKQVIVAFHKFTITRPEEAGSDAGN
jgi:hypothetical protein